MKILFWLALKLRLRQKFWGDWYLRWYKKQIKQIIDKIEIDAKDIKIIKKDY